MNDGFDVLHGILNTFALKSIANEIAALFVLQAKHIGINTFGLLDSEESLHEVALALLQADPKRYINAARESQNLPRIHRLLLDDVILATVRHCYGIDFPVISTKASVHIMADDLVVPGGYHRSPAHQDWRSIQGSLDNVVLWIPLTPVRGNGLEVIRGSHKHGLLPTKEHIMTPEVIDPERLGPWEAINCDPGDVVAFSSFLVHRTAAGPGLRIAISTRFSNAAEPTFIERGFPTPYKTTYRLDVPWEPPKP